MSGLAPGAHLTANPDELATFIRFRLQAFSEENAHHRFEELCFRLAKATVATNLLPPTGPVSAGGDQGRDFESYRVEPSGGAATRIFAAHVGPTDTVVFACTTQGGSDADLARKARDDVDTAVAREPRPNVVYFYVASRTMSPAARHALQDWGRSTHNVHVEIVDQRAIGEMLAEPPNHWLARHYLQISDDHFPKRAHSDGTPDWYHAARQRFSDPGRRTDLSAADHDLILCCADHARYGELRDDHALWLDVLAGVWSAPEAFATEPGLRAFYEAFVLLLRGGERCGLETEVPRFVDALVAFDSSALVETAHCFASYLSGGIQREHVRLTRTDGMRYFRQLAEWIERRIDRAPGPASKSDALVARGAMVFSEAALGEVAPPDARLASLATETVGWWSRALDAGTEVPFFPVLRLGTLVNEMVGILARTPEFDAFSARLEAASATRLTGDGLARSMRDRGVALLKAGRHVDALGPLLSARRHWCHGDRLAGSVLASRLAADCLVSVGLVWAARYLLYDTIALALRVDDRKSWGVLCDAAFRLGDLQFQDGDWCSAVQTFARALDLHGELVVEPWGEEFHEPLRLRATQLVHMLAAGDLVAPGFAEWGQEVAANWNLAEEAEAFGDEARDEWQTNGILGGEPGADILLRESPLADRRERRQARWSALGVRWEVSWANVPALENVAIELVAVVQLLLVALAKKRYLRILPGAVRVVLEPPTPDASSWSWDRDEDGAYLLMRAPREDEAERDRRIQIMVLANRVVGTACVDDDYKTVLNELADPLVADCYFVGPGVRAGRRALSEDDRGAWERCPRPVIGPMRIAAASCPKLPWPLGLDPAYDVERATALLRRRYEGGFAAAAPFLRTHGHPTELRRLVEELLADGYLDWQIVAALAIAADSGRVTADHVRGALVVNLVAAFGAWDLKLHHASPEIEGVRVFLKERFRHSGDDLPKEERPPFPWEARP